ncbi:MAG: hypothetical protein LBH43_03815 [Treponema sp.]|nr:hypothetical protein [Treponema sp.]
MVVYKEAKDQINLKEDKMMQTGIGVLLELIIKMKRGAVKITSRNQYFQGGANAIISGTSNAAKITPLKGTNLIGYEFIISGQYLAIYYEGKAAGHMIINTANWGMTHLIFNCGTNGDFTLTF